MIQDEATVSRIGATTSVWGPMKSTTVTLAPVGSFSDSDVIAAYSTIRPCISNCTFPLPLWFGGIGNVHGRRSTNGSFDPLAPVVAQPIQSLHQPVDTPHRGITGRQRQDERRGRIPCPLPETPGPRGRKTSKPRQPFERKSRRTSRSTRGPPDGRHATMIVRDVQVHIVGQIIGEVQILRSKADQGQHETEQETRFHRARHKPETRNTSVSAPL